MQPILKAYMDRALSLIDVFKLSDLFFIKYLKITGTLLPIQSNKYVNHVHPTHATYIKRLKLRYFN